MIDQTEITAATGRLSVGKIKPDDVETLVAVFRLYIKNKISSFPDLATRLAAAQDNNTGKTASKLVAILIQLEEAGFAVAELSGGRSGLKIRQLDKQNLRLRYGLTLLGYDLPEDFTGSLDSDGAASGDCGMGFLMPSFTVKKNISW